MSSQRFPYSSIVHARVSRVIDGDTLLALLDGSETASRIRLIGIDSPESVAPQAECNRIEGCVSSDYVKTLVKPFSDIWIQTDCEDADEYGRLLRYVWLVKPQKTDSILEIQSNMLNAILVAQGYARAKRYKEGHALDELFESLELEAVKNHAGVSRLWQDESL